MVALLKEQCFHELGIDIFRELYQKNARWYKAVTLVYYADMPQKEVAKRMGITLNALEGILKRARKWMMFEYSADGTDTVSVDKVTMTKTQVASYSNGDISFKDNIVYTDSSVTGAKLDAGQIREIDSSSIYE